MSPTLLFALVLGCSAGAILLSFHGVMRLNVHTDAFLATLDECLRNGDRARAAKLAGVVDGPVAALARQALRLRVPRFDAQAASGDHRAAAGTDFEARARTVDRLAPHVLSE